MSPRYGRAAHILPPWSHDRTEEPLCTSDLGSVLPSQEDRLNCRIQTTAAVVQRQTSPAAHQHLNGVCGSALTCAVAPPSLVLRLRPGWCLWLHPHWGLQLHPHWCCGSALIAVCGSALFRSAPGCPVRLSTCSGHKYSALHRFISVHGSGGLSICEVAVWFPTHLFGSPLVCLVPHSSVFSLFSPLCGETAAASSSLSSPAPPTHLWRSNNGALCAGGAAPHD